MNFLRRCARATTILPSSLSSYNSRHCTCYLRPITRSSPYSTYRTGGRSPKAMPVSSSLSQEVNKQAKEHLADSPIREIPYQAKVANLVKLIGHVKMPVTFQSFPNGKHYAATLICENFRSDKACWIPVLFEGDLAYVVSCHVKENDCVYVTGKLSVDPLPFALEQNQWAFHILGLDINFVEGCVDKTHEYSMKKKNLNLAAAPDLDDGNLDSEKKSRVPDFTDDSSHEEIDVNVKHSWREISVQDLEVGNIWTSLTKNPNQWLNYTDQKSKGLLSQKYPDFKNRETGTSLWLNSAPEWFLARFKNLDFDTSVKKQVAGKDSKIDELWKSVVETPDQWWDNRYDKRHAKAPDFKHKKTGEGLWLDSSPEWFVSKDIGLDKDNKGIVKDKEAWKSLVENPNQWWDNRSNKRNEKAPDFKHKDSGEGLWLNGLPDWVLSKLPPLKQNQKV